MRIKNFLQSLVFIIGGAGFVFAQGALVVYDPTKKEPKENFTRAEEASIKRLVVPKLKGRISPETCAEEFEITNAATGSFTRKGARQKAFLYEYCQYANGWSYGGIVITEAGKPVMHYFFNGAWQMNFWSLPDINKNSLNEMVVHWSGGMHQGMIGTGIVWLEVAGADLRELGSAQAYSSECDSDSAKKVCDYSWKITVKPGAKPVFYHQKMTGGDGHRWKIIGRTLPVKIEKPTVEYELVK